ncbi:cytochrome c3 family protein [Bacteroidota bacterium]
MKKNILMLVGLLGLTSFTFRTTADSHRGPDVRPNLQMSTFVVQDSVRQVEDVITTPSSIGEVVFPHLEHSEDFDVACNECHHEVNATALDIPHESYFEDFWIDCETCHVDSDKPADDPLACSDCHHDRPSQISDQALSSKVAIHRNCWDCHEVGTGAEASKECTLCHSGPKRPYAPLPLSLDSAR